MRFLLHVLPSGFHRIRHYGLLANAARREHLARARGLLHVVPATVESRPPDAPIAVRCELLHEYPIRRSNAASALNRPPPRADGFALWRPTVLSRPLRHLTSDPRATSISPWREVTVVCARSPLAFGCTTNRSIPIAGRPK